MKKFVTGTDASGRSCVVEESELVLQADEANPGFYAALVAATASSPPAPRPAGGGNTVDLGVGPGLVSWTIVDYSANLEFPFHHSDTLDFDLVLEGQLVLVLDDGEHTLEQDDLLVINGVDHGWKAGPDGCRVSVLCLGSERRA